MKVKFANRIYEVLFTKELAELTMYAVEDEPNHIDWLINVEVVDAEKKELKKIEQKPLQWNISDYKTWQYIVSDVLTKHEGIGQYLDDGICNKIAQYMQEEWSKRLSVEQRTTELPKGQDYGIDGLYAAIDILQKTLGEVDGYQSDDGILTHKCAISAVKELSKQEWSEEDEKIYQSIMDDTVQENQLNNEQTNWLKDIKYRYFPQPKSDWSEENETRLTNIIIMLKEGASLHFNKNDITKAVDWLKSIKERIQHQKEWSEEDKDVINHLLAICAGAKKYRQFAGCLQEDITKYQTWLKSLKPQTKQLNIESTENVESELAVLLGYILSGDWSEAHINRAAGIVKSLKPQNRWRPSDEQMFDLKCAADSNSNVLLGQSLLSLYNDLRKLKEE